MAAALKFGWVYAQWFMNEFVTYQIRLFSTGDADHGGPFIYHFIVLLVGCFPASILLMQPNRGKSPSVRDTKEFTTWMWLLFWVVLILFSIVKTKIVHYSSLCYFPLTYLAAFHTSSLIDNKSNLKIWAKGLYLFIGSLFATIIILIPVVGINKTKLYPYIQDKFAVANLHADVPWGYWECIPGILYLFCVWICILLMRKNFYNGLMVLCTAQIIIIQIVVLHFTPKIEAYTQNAAIAFYKQFVGKDVYVQPIGYKSYANLFYTQKTAATDTNYYDYYRKDENGKKMTPDVNLHWIINGKVDKPTYIICKIQDSANFAKEPTLLWQGGKNGFLWFKRR